MSALDEEDTSSTDSDQRAISNSAGEAQQAALPSTSSAYYAGLPALGLQGTLPHTGSYQRPLCNLWLLSFSVLAAGPQSAPGDHLGPPATSYFPAALQVYQQLASETASSQPAYPL